MIAEILPESMVGFARGLSVCTLWNSTIFDRNLQPKASMHRRHLQRTAAKQRRHAVARPAGYIRIYPSEGCAPALWNVLLLQYAFKICTSLEILPSSHLQLVCEVYAAIALNLFECAVVSSDFPVT